MTKVRGEREQKVRQGPGVTSGLGGRGDLRRSSLGIDPTRKMRLRISNKQTKKPREAKVRLSCLVVVQIK